MTRIKNIIILCMLVIGMNLTITNAQTATQLQVQPEVKQENTSTTQSLSVCVTPLELVNSPNKYVNKKITMQGKFDKFSTLGLDYKPAFKSSEEYISFMVKRDDTTYDIPLSELKLFLDRKTAEKFIGLKSGDVIKITGTVFSDALGDAWVDVNELTELYPSKSAQNK